MITVIPLNVFLFCRRQAMARGFVFWVSSLILANKFKNVAWYECDLHQSSFLLRSLHLESRFEIFGNVVGNC